MNMADIGWLQGVVALLLGAVVTLPFVFLIKGPTHGQE